MMPKGTYYIGDLCHVLTTEEWDEVCDIMFKSGSGYGEHVVWDKNFAIYRTKHGDGLYPVTGKRDPVSVDSGTVGCILTSDVSKEDGVVDGVVHRFSEPFYTGEQGGIIVFGKLSVDTVS